MADDSLKPADVVLTRFDQMLEHLSGLHDFAKDTFAARQGFFEKLILLDGATLTLLFTVIGGLSRSPLTKQDLTHVGNHLFIGCWLLVLSIMFSLAHNQLNIATLIHLRSGIALLSAHARGALLNLSLRNAGHDVVLPEPVNKEAHASTRKGGKTEKWCRWFGLIAQAATIFAYVEFVASLRTIILALTATSK